MSGSNVLLFAPIAKQQPSRAVRLDAMTNKITGYGTGNDHGQQFSWDIKAPRLSKWQRDDMYARDELVWKIIDLLPDNALRKWISFPKLKEADQKKLRKLIRDTGLKQALKHGFHMARLHEGAALYAPLFDGQAPDQPLNLNRLTKIGKYKVLEPAYLFPDPGQLDRSLEFEHYLMYDRLGNQTRVHVSRLIILPGASCSDDWRANNGGWWPSLLERVLAALVAYCLAHGLVPNILKDLIRDVIKLADMVDEDGSQDEDEKKALNEWLSALMRAESLLNKTVLGPNDEFIPQTRNTTGVPEMIGTTERRLTAAVGYPHTILLGESPGAALNGAGNSQKADWNEITQNYQADEVAPALDCFMTLAETVLGIEEIEYSFDPLSELSLKDKSEALLNIAKAGEKMLGFGITELELASMFAGSELSANPVLDLAARAALQKHSRQLLEDAIAPDPAPPPMPTPAPPVQNDSLNNGGPDHGQETTRKQARKPRTGK